MKIYFIQDVNILDLAMDSYQQKIDLIIENDKIAQIGVSGK